MKTMIRLAVCAAMAATSAPAFAGGEAARGTREGDEQVHVVQSSTTADSMPPTDDAVDFGAASGEPFADRQDPARDDGRAEAAAIQEYNRRRSLAEMWMATP